MHSHLHHALPKSGEDGFAQGLADDGQERTMQKGHLEESGELEEWGWLEDLGEPDERSDDSCRKNAVSDSVMEPCNSSSISRDSCVSAQGPQQQIHKLFKNTNKR